MDQVINYLLRSQKITPEQHEAAIAMAHSAGSADAELALVTNGIISDFDLASAYSEVFQRELVSLTDYPADHQLLSMVPQELCRKHLAFPVSSTSRRITVALFDPRNLHAVDDISTATGLSVQVVIAPRGQITTAIERNFRADAELMAIQDQFEGESSAPESLNESLDAAEDGDTPVVRFVNLTLSQAIRDRSSDIHIEPMEDRLRVRFRIDGVLHEVNRAPVSISAGVVSRIKVMAGLDISERRRPLDGRFTVEMNGRDIDLRVATQPTAYGEKVILRVLDGKAAAVSPEKLGMLPANLARFQTAYRKPNGLVVVTGPTGSGKSTTLYAAISDLNKESVNIVTVEDPIEMRMAGVNQMQVNAKYGLTFATALRSILRGDPDILLIGEIRDKETAQIAIEAALTGHLVLTTLHTNDAASTIFRLTEMGVEPYLISSSLQAVVAQRLVRNLCPSCKQLATPEVAELDSELLTSLMPQGQQVYEPVGCDDCAGTGYSGRLAIHEVMPVDDHIRSLIASSAESDGIEAAARQRGMTSLAEDGIQKVLAGETSLEELRRTVG